MFVCVEEVKAQSNAAKQNPKKRKNAQEGFAFVCFVL